MIEGEEEPSDWLGVNIKLLEVCESLGTLLELELANTFEALEDILEVLA